METIQIRGYYRPWRTVPREKAIAFARWIASNIITRGDKVQKVQKHIKGLVITQAMLEGKDD